MGDDLAGRLHTKRPEVRADEACCRDTTHGFIAWAVSRLDTSALDTSALRTSVLGAVVGGGVQAGAALASGACGTAPLFVGAGTPSGPMSADTDRASSRDVAEASGIVVNVRQTEPLPPGVIRHVGQMAAQRTGPPQPATDPRRNDACTRARAKPRRAKVAVRSAADQACKASADGPGGLVVSLLIGPFAVSWTATCGSRRRDA